MSEAKNTYSSSEVIPAPSRERRTRRRFATEYKRQIVEQVDQCKHGEIGEVLRREGLYSTQVQTWRRELAAGELLASKTRPGPAAKKMPEERQIKKLQAEISRLRKKLALKDDCLDLQKKALEMLEKADDGSDV